MITEAHLSEVFIFFLSEVFKAHIQKRYSSLFLPSEMHIYIHTMNHDVGLLK